MTNAETTDTTATVAAQGSQDAPEQASSAKTASRKKNALKGQKGATRAKPKATATKKAAKAPKVAKKAGKPADEKNAKAPRGESKGAKILEMIGRAKGATLPEIMKAAEWQAHSVRGFISTAGKKHGINIESSKNEAGERVYRIAK